MEAGQTRFMAVAVAGLAACLACACVDSSDGGGGSAGSGTPQEATSSQQAAACMAVEACGESLSECEELFGLTVLDTECATAIETAPCDQQVMDSPEFLDTCFPPCDRDAQACTSDGNAVRRCADFGGELRELVLLCNEVCAQNGGSWSGECSDNYMGQPSSDGEEVCWCG